MFYFDNHGCVQYLYIINIVKLSLANLKNVVVTILDVNINLSVILII